jgi:hypothetical protein
MKGPIQKDDTTILKLHAEHHCKFIKQTLLSLKEQIGPDSIIEVDFKISVSSIDRTFRHKLLVGDKVESESIGWS